MHISIVFMKKSESALNKKNDTTGKAGKKIMAMNMRNYGIAEGRMTTDPVIFDNKDGSKKVKIKLAVRDNYKDKDNNYGSEFIQFDGFIKKDAQNLGVYASMHKSDLVAIRYEVRSGSYKDANGNDVYTQTLLIQEVDLKESKSVTDARAEKRAAETAAGSPVAQPAAAVPAAEATPFN